MPASVDVQVHVGVPAVFADGSGLGGQLLPTSAKRMPSSPMVLAACGAGGRGHFNFEIRIPPAVRRQHQGLRLYLHPRLEGAGIDATPLEDPHANVVPLEQAVQGLLLPGVPRVFLTPMGLETLRSSPSLAPSKAWQRLLQIARDVPLNPRPHLGTSCSGLLEAIEGDLAQVPYVALACRVTDDSAQCQKARRILLNWANAATTGCTPEIEAGLTVGRYLGHIAEAYSLVAVDLTEAERATVRAFVLKLGRQIQRSSALWNQRLGVEGPNNHLQWHNYGMAVAGLLSGDLELVSYALASPANSQSYAGVSRPRHFFGMVQDSIFEADSAHNTFRRGDYDFGNAHVATGEIWDRYRHKPGRHGLAYSLFALTAMTYTGHLAALNGLQHGGAPLIASTDESSGVTTPSIFNALRFYSELMLHAVRCERGGEIAYAPYGGERACSGESNLGGFMVGAGYLTGDAQAAVIEAAGICRAAQATAAVDDAAAYLADTYPRDGIPQLYLLIVTGQYAAGSPQLGCRR